MLTVPLCLAGLTWFSQICHNYNLQVIVQKTCTFTHQCLHESGLVPVLSRSAVSVTVVAVPHEGRGLFSCAVSLNGCCCCLCVCPIKPWSPWYVTMPCLGTRWPSPTYEIRLVCGPNTSLMPRVAEQQVAVQCRLLRWCCRRLMTCWRKLVWLCLKFRGSVKSFAMEHNRTVATSRWSLTTQRSASTMLLTNRRDLGILVILMCEGLLSQISLSTLIPHPVDICRVLSVCLLK